MIVFRPVDGLPSLIETFFVPQQVFWTPVMIGFNDNDVPFRLNPRVANDNTLDPYDVFEGTRLQNEEPMLAQIVNDSVVIASQEIGLVGAFELRDAQVASRTRTPGFEFTDRRGANVPIERFRDVRRSFAGAPRTGGNVSLGVGGATDAQGLSGTAASGAQPGRSAALSQSSSLDAAAAAASLALTQNGAQAAARMTTIGVVGANGAPVPPGTEGAFTVSSGFSGKNDFLDEGPAVDYRSVGNEADRRRAARGAGEILYNLGLDDDYLRDSGHNLDEDGLECIQSSAAGQ